METETRTPPATDESLLDFAVRYIDTLIATETPPRPADAATARVAFLRRQRRQLLADAARARRRHEKPR